MTIKLNMHTARVTEGGKPIKKANNHKNKITLIDRNKYPYLSFSKGFKIINRNPTIKPIWSPERASR